MEAELVRELPAGEGWQYEPKWDGFRGVLENDGGELALWSRNERPLLRYFPELAPLGELLPPHSALDGEIVIAREGVLDFDSMQTRLHPAESRVRKLAAEIPAIFIAFDLLLWDGDPVHERPLEERRAELLRRGEGFWISPATTKLEAATAWLDRFEATGLDGVIAKRLGLAYMPGSREAVVKVKEHKTADCVVIGVRWKQRPERLATLLLGLYRDDGEVDYVGSAAVRRAQPRRDRRPGAAAARRRLRPALLGTEPLGNRRPRGDGAPARARRGSALRQGPGEPLSARHEADPLPRRQGSGPVHVARGEACTPRRRPDGGEPARTGISVGMSDYTKYNLREVENAAPKFQMPEEMEARFARGAVEGETLGLSLFTLAPNFRIPFGHKHPNQEEVYVLVSGSARIKVEDEVVELQPWDAVRIGKDTMRNMEAGPEGAEYLAFGAGTDPRDAEMTPGWWSD